jgi:hypothetical protein
MATHMRASYQTGAGSCGSRRPKRSQIVAGVLTEEGVDHYAVAMKVPEGNEFDIN